MELRHLKHFQAVAKELHFGRAALRLHVDQSSVSKSIKVLEASLDSILFKRGPRYVELTKQGEILLKETEQIFTMLENAKHKVYWADKSPNYFKLAISSNSNVHVSILADVLTRCRQEYPGINVQIDEVDHLALLRGLSIGYYHFGFSCSSKTNNPLIEKEKILDDRLVMLLPLKHPLVEQEKVSIKALSFYTLISFQDDSLIYERILTVLNKLNVTPSKVKHVKSTEVLLSLVSAGYGISLITETMCNNLCCNNIDIVKREILEAPAIGTYILFMQQTLELHYLKQIAQHLFCTC